MDIFCSSLIYRRNKTHPTQTYHKAYNLVLQSYEIFSQPPISSDWRDGSEEPTFQRRPNAKEPLITIRAKGILDPRDRGQNQPIRTPMRPRGICQMTKIHQLETKTLSSAENSYQQRNILVVIINARNISLHFTGKNAIWYAETKTPSLMTALPPEKFWRVSILQVIGIEIHVAR